MRPTLIRLAAVGLLVLAGCGDDSDDTDDSADRGADGESTDEFCRGFNEFDEQFTGVDPNDPEAMDDAVEALRALDPPDDIRDDYETMLAGFEALSQVDQTDQEAVADIQEEFADTDGAIDSIDDFVTEECGIDSE